MELSDAPLLQKENLGDRMDKGKSLVCENERSRGGEENKREKKKRT